MDIIAAKNGGIMAEANPFAGRVEELLTAAKKKKLDCILLYTQTNRRVLTDVDCDNGCLLIDVNSAKMVFYTDFRYTVMARRVAPWLETKDLWQAKDEAKTLKKLAKGAKRIGYEGSISARKFLALQKALPKIELVDFESDVLAVRAVKTPAEIVKLAASEKLNDEIWRLAQKEIKPGMTEKEIQRVIRGFMNALGDGEAFETIVCAGANAAECHHVPDDTVWGKGQPLLVDMGVKLDGVCSDMTRNIIPKKPDAEYRRIYDLVLEANMRAIAAVKPGITAGELDAVARDYLKEHGFDKEFGHSLGHGVGFEIHEQPFAAKGQKTVLRPGMSVTIEPGIYIEGKLGVRIEDLVVVTSTGCEVLSRSKK